VKAGKQFRQLGGKADPNRNCK